MKSIRNLVGILVLVFVTGIISGCGTASDTTTTPTTTTPTTTTPTTTTPTTTTTSTVVTTQVVSSLAINASQATLLSDGSDSVTITAIVLDTYSVVVPNAQVTFSANSGAISSGLVTTDAAGIATITLNKGAAAVGSTITVTASVTGAAGAITSNIVMSVVAPSVVIAAPATQVVSSLAINASQATLLSDGSDSVTITATVLDAYSVVIPNAQVTFTANSGAISSGLVTTDAVGIATITLNKGAAVAGATITVTASVTGGAGTLTSNIATSVVNPTLVPKRVSLVASSFTLLSDGSDSVTLTATVLDGNDGPLANVTVLFRTGDGALSAGSSVTDASGVATVTLNKGTAVTGTSFSITAEVSLLVRSIVDISVVDPAIVPTSINLAASSFTVLSDGVDSSTITATVLDANNAATANTSVLFSATGGVLSAASGVTDATGKVQIAFSAGTTGFNGLETVTATLSGVSPAVTRQLPIQIVGTTVGLVANNVNITDDGVIKDTLQVVVKNASNAPLYNVPVSVTQAGTGAVSVTPSATNTDVNGKITVDVVGTTAGNVTLNVTAAGATATQQYTVSVTGTAFGISAPAVDPYGMSVGDAYTITVNAPGLVSVTFATTTGTLTGVNPAVGPASVITQTVAAGTASVTLTGATAGVANIQVYDTNNPNTKDFTKITISPPIANTSIIRVQTNNGVILKSEAGLQHTGVINATVTDALNQPIANAPVFFSIPGVANGASISPVLVFSDANGVATTTFTSGNLSTATQGIDVFAEVVGFPFVKSSVNIIVGGSAGSIFIGRGSKIAVPSTTEYQLPMSVIVTDSSGAAVPGKVVSLEVWPESFRTGYWYTSTAVDSGKLVTSTSPCVTQEFPNEDINQNLINDIGEDIAYTVTNSLCFGGIGTQILPDPTSGSITYAANGLLDPPLAAAGSVPISVVTDSTGVANFNLTYLKGSANWIRAKVTAKTLVLGTESSSVIKFILPYAFTESQELQNSIFGQ